MQFIQKIFCVNLGYNVRTRINRLILNRQDIVNVSVSADKKHFPNSLRIRLIVSFAQFCTNFCCNCALNVVRPVLSMLYYMFVQNCILQNKKIVSCDEKSSFFHIIPFESTQRTHTSLFPTFHLTHFYFQSQQKGILI